MTDAELKAAIEEVRERARAHAPQGSLGMEGVEAADLMELVHARDAAEAKVAAIGTVNPRPPGLKNSIAQGVKRFISRALDWHVREQVEFNRSAMACVQASVDAMTAMNRSMSRIAAHQEATSSELLSRIEALEHRLAAEADYAHNELQEFATWRSSFEDRYLNEQIRILRTVSELQAAYQHRLTLQDESFRATVQAQHRDFDRRLEQSLLDVQKRLWDDMVKVRGEYERVIHSELRLLRQKQPATESSRVPDDPIVPASGTTPLSAPETVDIDWMRFAEEFRGNQERIRGGQHRYIDRFKSVAQAGPILDVGCGRGEFLEAANAAGIEAYGIELNDDCIALCQQKGLTVQKADLFAHLESLEDVSLGGLYCSQVIEHLAPAALVKFIQLVGAKLKPGSLAAFETPNPACLAIFATHFYIDPTHTRPVPPVLLRHYLSEAGFGQFEVEYLAPAVETLPAIADLPESIQETFFGGLDYALFATKL